MFPLLKRFFTDADYFQAKMRAAWQSTLGRSILRGGGLIAIGWAQRRGIVHLDPSDIMFLTGGALTIAAGQRNKPEVVTQAAMAQPAQE